MEKVTGHVFKSVVTGKNFMTPNVIGYYRCKPGIHCELSTGEYGTINLYGVTVAMHGRHDHERSKMFYSKLDAMDYIKSLEK